MLQYILLIRSSAGVKRKKEIVSTSMYIVGGDVLELTLSKSVNTKIHESVEASFIDIQLI